MIVNIIPIVYRVGLIFTAEAGPVCLTSVDTSLSLSIIGIIFILITHVGPLRAMATAIALQASSAPAVTAAPLTSDHHSRLLRHHRMSATTSPSASSLSNSPSSSLSANTTPSTTLGLLSRGLRRDGVSCDACLFRKSRCALNELVNKCYSCEFHRQDCTFTLANSNLPVSGETPQTKKRKLDQVVEINPNKRYDDIY